MLPIDIKQGKNSQPTFEIQISDTKYSMVLDGATEAQITVPAGANKVIFSSTNNFYFAKESFTIPSGTTPTLRACELNPGVRTVEPGETLYIQSISANTHVGVYFYSGGA